MAPSDTGRWQILSSVSFVASALKLAVPLPRIQTHTEEGSVVGCHQSNRHYEHSVKLPHRHCWRDLLHSVGIVDNQDED